MQLKINEELKNLIPTIAQEEYKLLEQSIVKEGCRDNLIVWQNTIIDGHNRYEICTKHNVEFDTKEMDFEDIEEVKEWMINNQLARRNLTDQQRKYLRGLKYEQRKSTDGGDRRSNNVSKPQNGDLKSTSQQIADEEGVSKNTIERDYNYKKSIDTIGETTFQISEKSNLSTIYPTRNRV